MPLYVNYSAIRTQTPGNYPKRNNIHVEHGESLRTKKKIKNFESAGFLEVITKSCPSILSIMNYTQRKISCKN